MNSTAQKISSEKIQQLQSLANEARIKVIEMITHAKSGHPAGSLGMADIFIALYFEILAVQPSNPTWRNRDYLLLSNGHICPILYAVLNMKGFFPAIELNTFRQLNSRLQGHPHYGSLPGIENTSGPLGQGISQAAGLALAFKRDKKKNKVFCVMSDGEQQEGQVWEAYQFINKYQLDNLTCIIDRNFIQIEGDTEKIMPLESLEKKIESFGLKSYQMDGHSFKEIITTIKIAIKDKQPSVIIANTTPGKGVSFMENKSEWHGKAPSKDEAQVALEELLKNK